MEGDNRVQVFARSRPLKDHEAALAPCVEIDETASTVRLRSECDAVCRALQTHGSTEARSFAFDAVYGAEATQSEVFEGVGHPVLRECMKGFNGTILAYGQTGSGKTHSLLHQGRISDETGLLPRLVASLFVHIACDVANSYEVEAAAMQVYNEQVDDLLHPGRDSGLGFGLNVQNGGAVPGLTWVRCNKPETLLDSFHCARSNLVYAETKMNKASSRSHAVFQIRIARYPRSATADAGGDVPQQVERTCARLSIVDLAGSERVKKSCVEGAQLKEALAINKSLLVFGNVVSALAAKRMHVPFRESKLTRILDGSIGGNCKTSLLVCLSPAAENAAETLSTIEFASRAMKVEVDAKVNREVVEVTGTALLQDLCGNFENMVVSSLREEIESLQRNASAADQRVADERRRQAEAAAEAERRAAELIDESQDLAERLADARRLEAEVRSSRDSLEERLAREEARAAEAAASAARELEALREEKASLGLELEEARKVESLLLAAKGETEERLSKADARVEEALSALAAEREASERRLFLASEEHTAELVRMQEQLRAEVEAAISKATDAEVQLGRAKLAEDEAREVHLVLKGRLEIAERKAEDAAQQLVTQRKELDFATKEHAIDLARCREEAEIKSLEVVAKIKREVDVAKESFASEKLVKAEEEAASALVTIATQQAEIRQLKQDLEDVVASSSRQLAEAKSSEEALRTSCGALQERLTIAEATAATAALEIASKCEDAEKHLTRVSEQHVADLARCRTESERAASDALEELRKELSDARSKVESSDAELDQLKKVETSLRSAREDLEDRLVKAEHRKDEAVAAVAAKSEEMERQLEALAQEHVAALTRCRDDERASVQDNLRDLERKVKTSSEELVSARRAEADLRSARDDLEKRLAQTEKQHSEELGRCRRDSNALEKQYSEELAQCRRDADALAKQNSDLLHTKLLELNELRSTLDELQRRAQATANDLAESQKAEADIRSSRESVEARLDEAHARLEELDGQRLQDAEHHRLELERVRDEAGSAAQLALDDLRGEVDEARRRAEQAAAEHSLELERVRDEADRAARFALDELRGEVREARRKAEEAVAELSLVRDALQERVAEAERRAEDASAQVASDTESASKMLAAAAEQFAADLAKCRADASAVSDQKVSEALGEMHEAKRNAEAELAEAAQRHTTELAKCQREADEKAEQALNSLRLALEEQAVEAKRLVVARDEALERADRAEETMERELESLMSEVEESFQRDSDRQREADDALQQELKTTATDLQGWRQRALQGEERVEALIAQLGTQAEEIHSLRSGIAVTVLDLDAVAGTATRSSTGSLAVAGGGGATFAPVPRASGTSAVAGCAGGTAAAAALCRSPARRTGGLFSPGSPDSHSSALAVC